MTNLNNYLIKTSLLVLVLMTLSCTNSVLDSEKVKEQIDEAAKGLVVPEGLQDNESGFSTNRYNIPKEQCLAALKTARKKGKKIKSQLNAQTNLDKEYYNDVIRIDGNYECYVSSSKGEVRENLKDYEINLETITKEEHRHHLNDLHNGLFKDSKSPLEAIRRVTETDLKKHDAKKLITVGYVFKDHNHLYKYFNKSFASLLEKTPVYAKGAMPFRAKNYYLFQIDLEKGIVYVDTMQEGMLREEDKNKRPPNTSFIINAFERAKLHAGNHDAKINKIILNGGLYNELTKKIIKTTVKEQFKLPVEAREDIITAREIQYAFQTSGEYIVSNIYPIRNMKGLRNIETGVMVEKIEFTPFDFTFSGPQDSKLTHLLAGAPIVSDFLRVSLQNPDLFTKKVFSELKIENKKTGDGDNDFQFFIEATF